MDLYGMCRRTHIRGLPQPTAPCYDTIWKNGNQQALVRMPRQIARYLPHHRSENASKTHPKSSHDKFKTASKKRF